jgi:hypothetical protein
MNKLLIVLVISVPMLMLSGCTVDTVDTVRVNSVYYDPGYSNDVVYSVGYYNNRPYWGNNYYYSHYWDWGGGYYNGY